MTALDRWIEEAKAIREKAPSGPWKHLSRYPSRIYDADSKLVVRCDAWKIPGSSGERDMRVAAFIVHAANNYARLLAALELAIEQRNKWFDRYEPGDHGGSPHEAAENQFDNDNAAILAALTAKEPTT